MTRAGATASMHQFLASVHGVAPERSLFDPVPPDYHRRLLLIMDRMTDSGRLMTGFNAI